MTLRFFQRFWKKVDREASYLGCWRWRGTHNPAGGNGTTRRPRVRMHRGRRSHQYVLRVMLSIYDGVPLWKRRRQKLEACHKPTCPHPWCINPAHAYWGTHDDNVRDRFPIRRTHADHSTRRAS